MILKTCLVTCLYGYLFSDNGFCMIALKRISALKQLDKSKDDHSGNKSILPPQSDNDTIPVPLYERW